MTGGSVLRLLTFTPEGDGAAVDAELRAQAPTLSRLPLDAMYIARRHDAVAERAVATTWSSWEAMRQGLGLESDHDQAALERFSLIISSRLDALPLAVDLAFGPRDDALVLRIYRGRIRPGELGVYVEEAEAGTIADDAAGRGPLALHLAVEEPDRFVTVSAWTDWDRIEAATGGNIRNPVATRHPERLLEGSVRHYEILPRAASESVAAGGIR